MLDSNYNVKLIDFGDASRLDAELDEEGEEDSN